MASLPWPCGTSRLYWNSALEPVLQRRAWRRTSSVAPAVTVGAASRAIGRGKSSGSSR